MKPSFFNAKCQNNQNMEVNKQKKLVGIKLNQYKEWIKINTDKTHMEIQCIILVMVNKQQWDGKLIILNHKQKEEVIVKEIYKL